METEAQQANGTGNAVHSAHLSIETGEMMCASCLELRHLRTKGEQR
jgi:hypothetical protein